MSKLALVYMRISICEQTEIIHDHEEKRFGQEKQGTQLLKKQSPPPPIDMTF
jgi:hypothetical protein